MEVGRSPMEVGKTPNKAGKTRKNKFIFLDSRTLPENAACRVSNGSKFLDNRSQKQVQAPNLSRGEPKILDSCSNSQIASVE